ncbi:MAG: FliO/MopB family protein [Oligoflexia bacterium]
MFSTRAIQSVFFGWVLSGVIANAAGAAVSGLNIKQVQVSENSRVDLLLDGRIQESQIRTEFINDIIQLSLSDVSVYPAKISSVQGQDLTKIFVYQYAPKLVRVRLSVKGRAEAYQGRLSVKPAGKVLQIVLDEAQSAQAQKKAEPSSANAKVNQEKSPGQRSADADERALLDRILSADKQPEKPQPEPKVRRARVAEPPGAGRMLASLVAILVLMAAAFFGLKKLAAKGGGLKSGALNRLLTRTLGKPAKMIDVVATHYLGPKKSIHVVKVAGRTLVLGVSDGSINLISEFQGDAPLENLPVAATPSEPQVESNPGDFLSTLGEQIARESSGSAPLSARSSARDRIRSRLEGMKQL